MKQMGLDASVMDRPKKVKRWIANAFDARSNAHWWLKQASNPRAAFSTAECLDSFRVWMNSARHCVKCAKAGI